MIKVSADKGIVAKDDYKKKIVANLYADTTDEANTFINNYTASTKVEGLPDDYTLDTETMLMSADGDWAVMKSDGTWKKSWE